MQLALKYFHPGFGIRGQGEAYIIRFPLYSSYLLDNHQAILRQLQYLINSLKRHQFKVAFFVMPSQSDEQLMKTAAGLVEGFQTLFGKHPGFRPGMSWYHFLTRQH